MKIGIMNGGGYKNWGDDAQLYHTIIKLKNHNFNDLVIFSRTNYLKNLFNTPLVSSSHNLFADISSNKDLLNKYNFIIDNYNNTSVLSSKEKTFIKNLSNIDILLFCGSGVINTRHLRGLCVYLLPCVLAKKLGKKVILTGQGIGPIDDNFETLITDALNRVDLISIRDFENGINLLKNLNIKTQIIEGVDDAFGYPITTTRFKNLTNKNILGINVSSSITPKLKKVLYNFAIYMKDIGYEPIFNHFQNEMPILKEITKNEFSMIEFNNPSEIAEFYSHCKLSIGMRYHSLIFALSQKVPSLNLYFNNYQATKIKAIEKNTGINLGINCIDETPNMFDLHSAIMKTKALPENIFNEWMKRKNTCLITYNQ